MLTALSVKNPELSSDLSDAFGKSKYFMIYDTDSKSFEFIANPFLAELGGAGIQTARLLIEKNIEAVITTHIGLNSLRFFKATKIRVYRCSRLKAKDAVKLLDNNRLEEILLTKSAR